MNGHGQPIFLFHARSGEINAFYNTCSHRGAPVVTEESGREARFTCKYHGWVYDDEGQLQSIRDAIDFTDLDFSGRSLRRVRFDARRLVDHYVRDIDCNQKIARTCNQSYILFPNWISPLGPTGHFILNFWPDGIDKSKLEFWWLGPDWGNGPRPAYWANTITYLNSVLREDTEFGRWIQKSQES